MMDWILNPGNWTGDAGILALVGQHLYYCGLAVLIAVIIGVPVGLYVGQTGHGRRLVVGAANSLRALPTLGLLVLLVIALAPVLRSELAFYLPSLVVLIILAVPPIMTNTFAGIEAVSAPAVDAARGLGMSPAAILFTVQLPCALPLILSGIRVAFLQVISTATVAAYVSLGGLGRLIIDGQAQQNTGKMIAGAILIALLVIVVDLIFVAAARLLVSPGLTQLPTRTRLRSGRRTLHPTAARSVTTPGETHA